MNLGRPHGPVVAALLTPVGLPTIVAAAVATGFVTWGTSALPGATEMLGLGGWIWICVYLYRLLRFGARRLFATMYRQPVRRSPRWMFLVLILITAALLVTNAPARLLFALQKPTFDAVAKHYYEEVPFLALPPPPKQVGIYPVRAFEVDLHGVRIHVDADACFWYCPDGPYDPYDVLNYLGGDWYFAGGLRSETLPLFLHFLHDVWLKLFR
jgi:hypothetical protein